MREEISLLSSPLVCGEILLQILQRGLLPAVEVQQRPPGWSRLEYLSCEEKVGELGSLSLDEGWLWEAY